MTKRMDDYYAAISCISDAWDYICPIEDQGHINRLARELRVEEGMTPRQVCTACVGALATGLKHGNWPSYTR